MGALGATVWRQQWLPIQRGLFALASALLLAYGVLLLSRTAADVWRGAWLERILGRLSGGLAAVASRVRASSLRARFPLAGRYLTGLAWGWCLVAWSMARWPSRCWRATRHRGGGHAGVRRGYAAEPADDVGRGRMVAWRVADALGSRCRGHRNRRIRHLGTRVCRVAARDAQRTWILPGTLTVWPDIRGGGAAGFAVRRYSRLRPRRNMAYNQPQFDSPPVAQIKIPSAAIGEAVRWPSRPGLSIRAGRRSSEAAVRCSSRPMAAVEIALVVPTGTGSTRSSGPLVGNSHCVSVRGQTADARRARAGSSIFSMPRNRGGTETFKRDGMCRARAMTSRSTR